MITFKIYTRPINTGQDTRTGTYWMIFLGFKPDIQGIKGFESIQDGTKCREARSLHVV
jgi:hypothetical protein